MDFEKLLLSRIADAIEQRDFFHAVLVGDSFDDWTLVRELGYFLVHIELDTEIMAHALLVRAHRHLGNTDLAAAELRICRERLTRRKAAPWEAEMLLPMLAQEEKLLCAAPS